MWRLDGACVFQRSWSVRGRCADLHRLCSGFAALAGHRKVHSLRNFDNAFRLERGDKYCGGGDDAHITAPLSIVYGYKGNSEVIVAGVFFRNIFGNTPESRPLPAFVALSNTGNVVAISFAHSRVNQELAKEGLLPWSRLWASNKPINAPAAAVISIEEIIRSPADMTPAFPALACYSDRTSGPSCAPGVQLHC